VIEYRSQQRWLFSALAHAYAMTCLVNRAKSAYAAVVTGLPLPAGLAGEPPWTPGPGLSRTLGVVKALASQTAARVAGECAERSGALGMFTVNRLVEYQGLGHMLGPAAGDSHLIMLDAGRTMAAGIGYLPPAPHRAAPDLSSRPDAAPSSAAPSSAAPSSAAPSSAAPSSAAPSSAAPSSADLSCADLSSSDLSRPGTCVALLRQRERALHQLLVARLNRAARRGQGPFEAWNNRAGLAADLAGAYGARLALESLLTDVDAVCDPQARAAAAPLCVIYALEAVAAHADWYLCEEMLTPHQVRRIPGLLTAACERVLPHARTLVDAFGIPDELIQAPILDRDYASALLRHGKHVTG
jgi:acyl-CoA oxidase